jgi:hypothetical protein
MSVFFLVLHSTIVALHDTQCDAVASCMSSGLWGLRRNLSVKSLNLSLVKKAAATPI